MPWIKVHAARMQRIVTGVVSILLSYELTHIVKWIGTSFELSFTNMTRKRALDCLGFHDHCQAISVIGTITHLSVEIRRGLKHFLGLGPDD